MLASRRVTPTAFESETVHQDNVIIAYRQDGYTYRTVLCVPAHKLTNYYYMNIVKITILITLINGVYDMSFDMDLNLDRDMWEAQDQWTVDYYRTHLDSVKPAMEAFMKACYRNPGYSWGFNPLDRDDSFPVCVWENQHIIRYLSTANMVDILMLWEDGHPEDMRMIR